MTALNQPVPHARSTTRRRLEGRPAHSRRLDALSLFTSTWLLLGLYLDGWAHNHIAELETFFTPWHAVLYSGFFSVALLLSFTQYRGVARGYAWSRALPLGYGWSLLGVIVFFIGGVGDMIWHELFGIEQGLEALFSPTHLLLAAGGVLFVAGPLRAAWSRTGLRGWRDLYPVVITAAILLSLFTFFMQYASIFSTPSALVMRPSGSSTYFVEATNVFSILAPTGLTIGVLLFLLRRWQLPFGAATFIFTVNGLLMLLMRFDFASPYWRIVVAAGLGGLLADVLIARLQPSLTRVTSLRLIAFAVPCVTFLLIFAALAMTRGRGLWWPIHMWLGVPVVAGAVGLGLSFLLAPPPVPAEP
ncbi:MAG: hypothetical protein J0L63_14620 [Anaerolineae bacterium]|nr:hypothetical protein [Anaerolineae bacterium]